MHLSKEDTVAVMDYVSGFEFDNPRITNVKRYPYDGRQIRVRLDCEPGAFITEVIVQLSWRPSVIEAACRDNARFADGFFEDMLLSVYLHDAKAVHHEWLNWDID